LALRSACFAPLWFSPSDSVLCRILCRDSDATGRARLNAENAITANDFDGNPLLLCPLANLLSPARIVTLVHAGDLCRLARAQETEDCVPIDFAIFLRIV